MAHRPGGGIESNKTVHRPEPKVRPISHKANVETAATQGLAVAFEKQPLLQRGAGYNPPVGPTNNLVSGPGGGRTVYESGSQHGLKPVHPLPPGRDPLNQE
jgi:hypothetical protein